MPRSASSTDDSAWLVLAGGRGTTYESLVSRAFTKDGAEQNDLVVPPRAPVPSGVANYVTPSGLRALREESTALLSERHHVDARDADDPDRARALALVMGKLAALEERIACAELVPLPTEPTSVIRFGATVRVRGARDERSYRIVGVDEADATKGRIAFVAPIARALLGHQVGDEAEVVTPRGREIIEVLGVVYEEG